MSSAAQEILSILVEEEKLPKDVAGQIKVESINSDTPIEILLLKRHLVSEKDYAQARAKSLKIDFVDLSQTAIAPDVVNYISEPVARKYILVPYKFNNENNELYVAMQDPLDFQIIEFLEKKSGKKIMPTMAMKDEIMTTIESTYSQGLGADVSEALKETDEGDVKTYEAGKLSEVIREAPIAQIVSAVLELAIRIRASDVHIEPMQGDTRVRFRVDGILQERLTLPRKLKEAVVSRIKILADLKIDEKRVPQDGRFNFKMGEKEVDLRVSTLPSVNGEKIVMRLLKKTGGIPNLPELGLRGLALKTLESNIKRPHGIILVSGPTGSGKTTTLYSVLSKLNNTQVNIMTLEDPVEYQIAGVNQVQVNPKAGLTFSSGLRSFLRQDPDIILVGEIRDEETAELAIQAALTGHLVFSTLHTNNAAGTIPRLLDMKAEPFLVASSLNAVVGQRITRKICPSCKEEYDPESLVKENIKKVLGPLFSEDQELKLYKGKGKAGRDKPCPSCNGSGYFGRIGIFEVFSVTDKISNLILSRKTTKDVENEAISTGMITMMQDGFLKALEGITTIEEVLRVAQE